MSFSRPIVTLSSSSPIWRSFLDISANAEAYLARSSSGFSLSTLEIANCPGVAGFALTEQIHPDLWRWATVSIEGPILDEGSETTQSEAKRSAVEALRKGTTLT
jgi:hypothetical protein